MLSHLDDSEHKTGAEMGQLVVPPRSTQQLHPFSSFSTLHFVPSAQVKNLSLFGSRGQAKPAFS